MYSNTFAVAIIEIDKPIGKFILHTQNGKYTIKYNESVTGDQITIAIKDKWLRDSSFSEEITAFKINDKLTGLHLSSYYINIRGSMRPSLGMDVFLVLNTTSRKIWHGGFDLGISKKRIKESMGCRSAHVHHFQLSDIDGHDGVDIGITKEELICEYDKDTEFPLNILGKEKNHPVKWFLFNGKTWQHNKVYDGKVSTSESILLPLIGIIKTPVDYLKDRLGSRK